MECSLHDLVHRWSSCGRQPLSLSRIVEIGIDIANGLWHLHPSVIHRDLKPQNILLDNTGTAKIADFGISRIKQDTYLATKRIDVGTVPYMAPECFGIVPHVTERSDIYSFGIIMWECITGQRPWANCAQMAIIYQVEQRGRRPEWPKSVVVPESLKRLIKLCWHPRPRERPSSGDILKKLTQLLYRLKDGRSQSASCELPQLEGMKPC